MGTSIADIEQPLTGRNLIKPTDLVPKQAQDCDLYLVEAFDQVMDFALHSHADAMNPLRAVGRPNARSAAPLAG